MLRSLISTKSKTSTCVGVTYIVSAIVCNLEILSKTLLVPLSPTHLDTQESQVLLQLVASVGRREKVNPTDQVEMVVTDIVLPAAQQLFDYSLQTISNLTRMRLSRSGPP